MLCSFLVPLPRDERVFPHTTNASQRSQNSQASHTVISHQTQLLPRDPLRFPFIIAGSFLVLSHYLDNRDGIRGAVKHSQIPKTYVSWTAKHVSNVSFALCHAENLPASLPWLKTTTTRRNASIEETHCGNFLSFFLRASIAVSDPKPIKISSHCFPRRGE